MLHYDEAKADDKPSAPPEEFVKELPNYANNVHSAMTMGTLPIIPVFAEGPTGKRKKIYIFPDSGADFDMMEDSLANEIEVVGEPTSLKFKVFGDHRHENSTVIKSLKISGCFRNAPTYEIKNVYTVPKLGIGGISIDAEGLKRNYPYLKPMKVKSVVNAVPTMLLSYAHYELFAAQVALESKDLQGPSAYRSRLGWYVRSPKNQELLSCHLASGLSQDDVMHEEIKQFFSTEAFGVTPIQNFERSKEDKRAMELLEKHTVKKGNRWETCLLWRDDEVKLPPSKKMAMDRLASMEKKMDRDPTFAKVATDKFEDYIKKGYLVPRSKAKFKESATSRKWYLPWFFHYHPDKKPRWVLDAAAKSGGFSLNDFLLEGPDQLNPLPAVLKRFRRYPISLSGDIKEMFHQVGLREEDWPSQTVLYRGMDRSSPPEEYYMTVLFFGSASSPCSAIYAKNKNGEYFADIYPKAVEAIFFNFYMDDFLGGADTEEEAIELRRQLTEIFSSGGFQLVKWNSNSKKVLDSIPKEMCSDGAIGFLEKSDYVEDKTLGMWWCPMEDTFSFKLSFHRLPSEVSNCKQIPTKRQMTGLIMAVFDPLGFLAPLKVKALMLIQDVWRSKVDWDELIPANIFQKWCEWIQLLQNVKGLKIPRRLTCLKDVRKVSLHTFTDASEEAFCCAVYALFENEDERQCTLLSGKARVAPIKGLSVPKMELQGAVLGTRLAETVEKVYSPHINLSEKTYWIDSKCVLTQLRSNTLRYKAFEGNRIGEILTLTNVPQWKWVPTDLNVADDGTRFSSNFDPTSTSRWLIGPRFLLQDRSEWPVETSDLPSISCEDLGLKNVCVAVAEPIAKKPETTFDRCSTWDKLIRSTAQCLVFWRKLKSSKKRVKPEKPYVTVADKEKAKRWLIRQAQEESFPEEIAALEGERQVSRKSRIRRLSPTLVNGIIVLQGRIEHAPKTNRKVIQPPILDAHHKLTKLLIEWCHKRCGHYGQEQGLSLARQEAWILDARAAVRRCWINCQECKEQKAQPKPPSMGQLPAARLGESTFPFHNTGVDYFGPFHVAFGRKSIKRWGVMLTCMSTRAVHLELADSLDTSDMIEAFVRFMAVRGRPTHLWSDNGTNFIGANREMAESYKDLEETKIAAIMEQRGVEWHFNPPSSPHMGGSWERLIGSVKRILSHLLKSKNPKESTLRTLFAEIMEILNNRPLTYASTDPDDPECLTPNHLLHLKSAPQQSVPGVYVDADAFRKSWRNGQLLADHFWRRWIAEYLPKLAHREKWIEPTKPLEIGDLVIVINDQAPRSAWKKGVIVATFPARDGKVRKVDVRVAHVDPEDKKKVVHETVFHRPAMKVCPLGINIYSVVPPVTGGENNVAASDNVQTDLTQPHQSVAAAHFQHGQSRACSISSVGRGVGSDRQIAKK